MIIEATLFKTDIFINVSAVRTSEMIKEPVPVNARLDFCMVVSENVYFF
jgi:hypothetical protein